MNTPILFLLGAVALSGLGGLVVWVASRPRPERFGSSIDTFNRDLDALAPPGSKPARSRRNARATRPHAAAAPQRQTAAPQRRADVPGPRPMQAQVTSQQSTAPRVKPGPRPGPRS